MASSSVVGVIVGVDVGGTNTDAVVLAHKEVLASAKTATTSDVTTGVKNAIRSAILEAQKKGYHIGVIQVNIGTTHFVNAIVQRKRLTKVAIIRLCGPSARAIPPLVDFPPDLKECIGDNIYMLNGGFQYDATEITSLDENEVSECIEQIKAANIPNIVIVGIFSPVKADHEKRVGEIISSTYPEATYTCSHEIGQVGLIERENAAILNECLKPLCQETVTGFRTALTNLGLNCPFYLTQNDGTVISAEKALQYPVLTFASGPTNSMRGAAFLSGLKDAVVVDIGGTTTDVGVLKHGFPREASTQITVGGVRTNFRMPDVLSIGLGGGSYVKEFTRSDGKKIVRVGPVSAGYKIADEGMVFQPAGEGSKGTLTATDIAVAAGLADVGIKENVSHLAAELVSMASKRIHQLLDEAIDKVKLQADTVPVILVGGGSILIDRKAVRGADQVILPPFFDVANAAGAALSQVAAVVDTVYNLMAYIDEAEMKTAEGEAEKAMKDKPEAINEAKEKARKSYLDKARNTAMCEAKEKAIEKIKEANANPDTVEIVEMSDIPLSYLTGNCTQLRVKAVGDLAQSLMNDSELTEVELRPEDPDSKEMSKVTVIQQTATSMGTVLALTDDNEKLSVEDHHPKVDPTTGAWELSDWDLECIAIGAGILGCGGGGHPYTGKILAKSKLKEGKKMMVVTPERLFRDADEENDVVVMVAFFGSPLALYEKLSSGDETANALSCLQDLYRIGQYKDGHLGHMDESVIIKEEDGIRYIDDYKPLAGSTRVGKLDDAVDGKRIIGLICAEIGGMNSISPLTVAADLEIPVLDCDGMGRAFPELQMFMPFIYGLPPYPGALVDDKGRRAVVLKCQTAKQLEDHFRRVVMTMGCGAGVSFIPLKKEDVMDRTVLYSFSRIWRLGRAVMEAHQNKTSPVEAILNCENGKRFITGKISDVHRDTAKGYTVGWIRIEGMDSEQGQRIHIDFRNENLRIRRIVDNKPVETVAIVPDLICIVDSETGHPIMTEEVRYGLRVTVLVLAAPRIMQTELALRHVGPGAFGFSEDYFPIAEYKDAKPVPLL